MLTERKLAINQQISACRPIYTTTVYSLHNANVDIKTQKDDVIQQNSDL